MFNIKNSVWYTAGHRRRNNGINQIDSLVKAKRPLRVNKFVEIFMIFCDQPISFDSLWWHDAVSIQSPNFFDTYF